MDLIGYSDRWTVRPGENVGFHVHCTAPTFDAALVRLIHGDDCSRGPGFKEIEVPSVIEGTYPGHEQRIRKGSYGVIDIGSLPDLEGGYEFSLWVWPTLVRAGRQGLVAWQSGNVQNDMALVMAQDGRLECVADGKALLSTECRLREREWYRLSVSYDRTRRMTLEVLPKRWSPDLSIAMSVRRRPAVVHQSPSGLLLLAATGVEETSDGPEGQGVFNGKIARPRLIDPQSGKVLGQWDLGVEAGTRRLVDTGGNGLHGETVNRPARLMSGPDGPYGASTDAAVHETNDAIHFHDDDVADVGWPESLRLSLPLICNQASMRFAPVFRALRKTTYHSLSVRHVTDPSDSLRCCFRR